MLDEYFCTLGLLELLMTSLIVTAAEAARQDVQKRVPKGTSKYQAAWIMDDASTGVSSAGKTEAGDNMSDSDDDEVSAQMALRC